MQQQPSPCPDAADDPRPYRSLCAAVMLQAVKDLHLQVRHTSRRNAASCELEKARTSARKYFFRHDPDPRPFNLAFCCAVLDLDIRAIRQALKKRSLNAVALKRALSGKQAGDAA